MPLSRSDSATRGELLSRVPVECGHGARCAGYRARGAGHRAWGAGHGVLGIGQGALGTGHGAQGTGLSTGYTPTAEQRQKQEGID